MPILTKFPGTIANAGSGDSWTNTANAAADDNAFASVGISGSSTKQLKCTNFDFSAIPDTAIITGIRCIYERKDAVLQAGITSANVYLVTGGTVQTGVDFGDAATWAALAVITATLALMGITTAILKASDFGVAIVANAPGGLGTASIDYVSLEVTYSTSCLSATGVG